MNPKPILAAIVATLCLFGCTRTLYTHQQVMSRYTSKEDVVRQFGLPTEKRSGEGIEEWLYSYGTIQTASRLGNSRTNASVTAGYNTVYGNANTNSLNVTTFSSYDKYVKFTFDKNSNLLRWNTQGIDFTEKKVSTGKTIAYIILCMGIGVGLAIVANGGN